ncbi:TonB-linked outer membrane protein, SusC/RagA family [Salinimicrobium catena]|uniref:TonB-linked outer membrane protein, SusC/RagA family n=1 Tax=Salinimicrobium catena TaxID=390640 RepID=A0A1H5K1X2_9FLAO|nr:TonB-dependent receptor [Salinimicrobium catena]SDK92749.1 TonB-linked outer membrane protein, SusC/RagA family [Salinimicrobium catena]SEE58487.1 TonB-linked outer membrane protein, SusC/RagA family [Salinimicrobium catena]
MKKSLSGILTLLLVLVVQISFAQERTITGTVVDENDLPLLGVNVLIKGTAVGTQTDFDGMYQIQANQGDVLVFTYVGMERTERTVGANNTINVSMAPDAQSLQEVIVVGYGEQTRKSLTTAVAKVDGEQIKSIATPTVSGALQGTANGLQVNQNSGAPGGGFSVRVRGASSISGSNEPLYVVDGVPILSGSIGENDFFGGQNNDVLANINFSDIESIQVLKDASSAAIYGARGANGVVLITTKRGKAGKTSVEVNSYTGFQEPIDKYELFTAGQYYEFGDRAFESAFGVPGMLSQGMILGENILEREGAASLEELYAMDFGDDYIDAVYRDGAAIVRQTDVTLSGGSEKARFYTNFTDFNQEGAIRSQLFKRRSLSFNANFQANEKMDLDAGVSITESFNRRVNGDNNIYGVLSTAVLERPGEDLFNEDGTYNTSAFIFSNPLQNALVDKSTSENLRIFSNLGLRYEIYKDLSFYSKASLERLDYNELVFNPATTRRGQGSNGYAYKGVYQINRWNVTNTLNYSKNVGDFDFTGLLGFSFEGTNTETTQVDGNQIPAGLELPGNAAVPTTAYNAINENKLFSYFGRAGISYLDKIFFEGTLRADASSVFGAGQQIGYFPAFSGAYIISDEDFMENNTLTNWKLRASWGQTGNSTGLGNYGSRGLAYVRSYEGNPGLGVGQLAAPDLSWETTTQLNVGTDITLFDRIDLTYDYYVKTTDDLLLSRPLRNSSGFTSVAANVGKVENRGHEISLNARIFQGDFNWTAQVQAAYNENEILALERDAAGEYIPIDRGFATRLAVGESLGAFYGLQADGIYREGDEIPDALVARGIGPGDVRYIDVNGDGTINANDRTFIGNAMPKWTGNFRNTFRWNNFDLSANLQFEQDKDIFNNSLGFAGASGSWLFNKFSSQLDYYTEDNQDATLPAPRYGSRQSYNNQDSDRFIEDASYVRLKEVVLGYTLNPEIKGTPISLRIYVGGDNLWTETDYTGLDPEVNAFGSDNAARGTDFFTQGLNKVYKVGVNLKF